MELGADMGALIGVLMGGFIFNRKKMILGPGTLDGKKGTYMGRACSKYSSIFPMLIGVIIPASMAGMNIIY